MVCAPVTTPGTFRQINDPRRGEMQMTSDRVVKSIQTGLFTLVLLLAGAAVAQTPGQMPPSANIPKNMKQYFLCLLTRGDKWTPLQFADPAMQDHLAFIREQMESGKFVMAVPVLVLGRLGALATLTTSSLPTAHKTLNSNTNPTKTPHAPTHHPPLL